MSDTAASVDLLSDDEPLLLTVPPDTPADRLDKVLAGLLPGHSRSRLQGWIEAGYVFGKRRPGQVRQAVGPGDVLSVWEQPAPESRAFAPEPVAFDVVAESPGGSWWTSRRGW